MLVEPRKNGDVVTLKITSNEEIIGTQVDITDLHVIVDKPMTAIMHENGMGLMPYVMTVSPETKVKINKSLIVVHEKTAKPIADEYKKNTSTIATI
jgi:hypothetical protein